MKIYAYLLVPILIFFSALGSVVYGEDSPIDRFINSPLLILAGLLVVCAIALIYHKMRR